MLKLLYAFTNLLDYNNFPYYLSVYSELRVLYDPNADIRTRYRSKVYSEQCVQSKHREITNYYIGTTVAFIACYISDLIFLEGQICILTIGMIVKNIMEKHKDM